MQSLLEVKISRGSPICERVCEKIVEYFKNNVPQFQIAKALQISSSTVHNSSVVWGPEDGYPTKVFGLVPYAQRFLQFLWIFWWSYAL